MNHTLPKRPTGYKEELSQMDQVCRGYDTNFCCACLPLLIPSFWNSLQPVY